MKTFSMKAILEKTKDVLGIFGDVVKKISGVTAVLLMTSALSQNVNATEIQNLGGTLPHTIVSTILTDDHKTTVFDANNSMLATGYSQFNEDVLKLFDKINESKGISSKDIQDSLTKSELETLKKIPLYYYDMEATYDENISKVLINKEIIDNYLKLNYPLLTDFEKINPLAYKKLIENPLLLKILDQDNLDEHKLLSLMEIVQDIDYQNKKIILLQDLPELLKNNSLLFDFYNKTDPSIELLIEEVIDNSELILKSKDPRGTIEEMHRTIIENILSDIDFDKGL